MQQKLDQLKEKALAAIAASDSEDSLQDIRVRFLGKKGELTTLLKEVSQLSVEERPIMGKAVNLIKAELVQVMNAQQEKLQEAALAQQLAAETVDITLPGRAQATGHLHPISQTKKMIGDIFHRMGFQQVEGPEIEDDYHNFTALNIPAHHPAREGQDTFYFDANTLLRTQTSSVQIRTMKNQEPPVKIISMGRVYRRDSDRTHTPMFHQMECLWIDKDISFADLKGVLKQFLQQFFGRDVTLRLRPSYFPFTEPSAEVDIQCDLFGEDKWLEVLGCGMVHPNVLKNVGIDPNEYTGFAFGLGLDRFAMLKFGIPDLRLMFEGDSRFLQQF